MAKAKLIEKIGYGFGDMSSSTFWKVFSYYLPIFYSNIFGLSLIDAGVLVLVTRIWDAVSDPMMGIIADRTNTKWGKYRPYLLWIAPLFSICGILLFTTPDWNYGAKLCWAYVTYIMMMTVYTGINVPYGATSSTPGTGRSPGDWDGNPLQYSCLENPHGQRSLAVYCP